MNPETIQQVGACLARATETPTAKLPDSLNAHIPLAFELDSMDLLRFAMELEQAFDIQIDDRDMERGCLDSWQSLAQFLDSQPPR